MLNLIFEMTSTKIARKRTLPSPQNFDAGNGMNFIPAVVAIGYVGAGDADMIANIGNRDLRMKRAACDFVSGMGRLMLADYLYYKFATGAYHVDQV